MQSDVGVVVAAPNVMFSTFPAEMIAGPSHLSRQTCSDVEQWIVAGVVIDKATVSCSAINLYVKMKQMSLGFKNLVVVMMPPMPRAVEYA